LSGHDLIEVFQVFDPFELVGDFVSVGDQEHGDVLVAAHAAQQVDHLLLMGGIDIRRGFISQQQRRPIHERTRHGYALLLADR
jgi:hypothetical protein